MHGINRQRTKRPPCGKRTFSESKAKGVIKEARRSQSSNRRECRAYFCAACGGWHTTSQRFGEHQSN